MFSSEVQIQLPIGLNFQFMANVPDALTACLTVYRGSDERSRRTRFSDAESDEIRFTLSQGYNVTHAILVAHLRSTLPADSHPQLAQLRFKIKPSNDARQNRFILMSEDNFDSEIRRIYRNAIIRQRLRSEDVRIPFVVYINESEARNQSRIATTSSSLRRATVARIQTATEEITARMQSDPLVLADNELFGDVSMHLWARQRARNPNPEPVPEMPQSNVFRQALRMDHFRQSVPPQRNALEEYFDVPFEVLTTQPGTIRLHIPTLRRALGLPSFPLFSRDIFNADEAPIPGTVSQDIEDVDHPLSDDD